MEASRTLQRLAFEKDPAVVYAIGDVHGELDLLLGLESLIEADAAQFAGEKWVVMLGDYVDRGPNSAGVLDHLTAAGDDEFRRFFLAGNHEVAMLDFIEAPSAGHQWLGFGGWETLMSYGIDPDILVRGGDVGRFRQILSSHIPDDHLRFLEGLAICVETPSALFVHAGVRPGVALAEQEDQDLIWFRDGYANDYHEFSKIIVHGHTPRTEPLISAKRIAIDTGACFSGTLTAARLVSNGSLSTLQFSARSGAAKVSDGLDQR